MKRLTQKDDQGNWCLKCVLWSKLRVGQAITQEIYEKLYGALWKLMDYEDTGLSPEEVESLKEFEGSNTWIPISERLPEPFQSVIVTVHHSEWISDYDSDWVPDEGKKYHPESRGTYLAFVNHDGRWTFQDESNSETLCDEKFGDNKGSQYSVVIAWMPLPAPYNLAPVDTRAAQLREREEFFRE